MTSSPHPRTMRRLATVSALASTIALSACVTGGPRLVTPDPPPVPDAGPAVPSSAHVVLENGQQVVANSAAGKMKIEAGPGLRRIYDWDGLRRGAIVNARSTPFAGGKTAGLTYDGTPKVWEDAKGITQLRYEEGERHYETMDDAMIWMQIRRLYYVYNDNGLVLGWKRDGDTLHVELWQFYIDGSKPTSMPDSNNASIVKGPLEVVPQKMYPHLVFDDGHTEPYNTETASQYKGAGSSKSDTGTSQCNWFQRLFHRCPTPAPSDQDENQSPAASAAGNAANAGAQQPASGSGPASGTQPAADAAGQSTDTSNAGNAAPEQDSAPTATISGDTVNIRSQPSTHSKVLKKAHQGDSVKILKSDRGWRYVAFDDGQKGWVADFLLKH